MKDDFTTHLEDSLSTFVKSASDETLSEAFLKANFDEYRHSMGSIFGISEGQTRTGSFIESISNVAIGIGIAFISQELIFPFYGIHVSTRANLEIVAWFTAISLARSFLLRRLFNRITTKTAE